MARAREHVKEVGAMHVVMDIWGGFHSEDLVARFIRPLDDCFDLSREELGRGFLVSLRADAAWGDYTEFDNRKVRKS